MDWQAFSISAPQLAALGEERFDRTGLVLLATLRKTGWPRISPLEFLVFEGQLYLGMMWQSRKALDLLRDPRCSLHSTVSDRQGSEGEFKLYGQPSRSTTRIPAPATRKLFPRRLELSLKTLNTTFFR